ncbi:MAG TPA: DUF2231 domain-containing protein, partial [Polyangia bacterium]
MALRLLLFDRVRAHEAREASALQPMSTLLPSALLALTPLLDIVLLITRNPAWARAAFWTAFLGAIVAALSMAGFFYVLLRAGWHPGA